jgi:hypothetical protein
MTSATAPDAALPRPWARRLRETQRSAGWPVGDALEVELLAAGLLAAERDSQGRTTLHLSPLGLQALAGALRRNRGAYDAHEALCRRVAAEMQRDGRIAWRELSLRAHVEGAWTMVRPDVYSIRHTTVESWVVPIAHEVKVRRADLLADLQRPAKRAAYLALSAECSYVIAAGIAEPEEIAPECGVIVAHAAPGGGFGRLERLRDAPRRAMTLPLAVWMALARANPLAPAWDEMGQGALGDPGEPGETTMSPIDPDAGAGGAT